ncbi:MAG: adenylate/guanylate cyclase domain-containing protein, partial [Schleiferiaceae bacterium]|nr:adenylate/guanylate cyclase domain-containing protein [Schleiferiaceae bacterium]
EIMQKYGIEKIKTIGDAYMAAGGLHVPRTSQPVDVVKAGLEMQQFMLSRIAEKEKANEPFFEMRVGIHTGPVVAGIVGVKKFQYDIWGDTVNTASRMESHGLVGKVNLSSTTYELIKDQSSFSFEKRETIEVKGKGEMEMWFVKLSS